MPSPDALAEAAPLQILLLLSCPAAPLCPPFLPLYLLPGQRQAGSQTPMPFGLRDQVIVTTQSVLAEPIGSSIAFRGSDLSPAKLTPTIFVRMGQLNSRTPQCLAQLYVRSRRKLHMA